ncbi:MAG: DUF4139 domain-containing protein [Myxococcales bacterium]|nr:DUF4139 domain-containing protein [Myxococcales bacterium]
MLRSGTSLQHVRNPRVAPLYGSPTPEVETAVEAVVVYREGARVTRRGTLEAAAGRWPERVRVRGLPLPIDHASVRVRVEGPDGALGPVAATAHTGFIERSPEWASGARLDEEALREATLTRDHAAAEVGAIEGMLEDLAALDLRPRPEPDGEAPLPSPTEARLALVSFRRKQGAALGRKLAVARRRLAECERTLEAVAADRARPRQPREGWSRTLEIDLAPAPGLQPRGGDATERLQLVVEYLVAGARWSPGYALFVDPDLHGARLELTALVAQCTGEDWNDAELTVTTARRERWVDLPRLEPIRIAQALPRGRGRGWRPPAPDTDALFADYDLAFAADAEGLGPAYGAPQGEMARRLSPRLRRRAKALRTGAARGAGAGAGSAEDAAHGADEVDGAHDGGGGDSGLPPHTADGGGTAAADLGAPATTLAEGAPRLGARRADPGDRGAAPVPREWLDYRRLRLPDHDDPRRGRLVRAPEERAQPGGDDRPGASQEAMDAEVAEAAERARLRASALAEAELPEGYSRPEADTGPVYAYEARHTAQVASDGRFTMVPLFELPCEARPRYIAIPQITSSVFRELELEHDGDQPLLGGPVHVYVGDAYAMTSRIPWTAAGGRFELSLGVEPLISVSRLESETESTSGLIRGAVDVRHDVRVDIESNLPHEIRVEVRERVPVGPVGQQDVRVSLDEVRPPWGRLEPERTDLPGRYRWLEWVASGGRLTLRLRYTVRLPSSLERIDGVARLGR